MHCVPVAIIRQSQHKVFKKTVKKPAAMIAFPGLEVQMTAIFGNVGVWLHFNERAGENHDLKETTETFGCQLL